MPIPGKRKSLALYEVINERGLREPRPQSSNGPASAPAPAHRPAPAASEPGEPPRLSIAPGQSIRVPVGYLFFTIALLVLVGVAGYSLGYHQHKRVTMEREADEAARMGLTDPLNEDPGAYESLTMGAPERRVGAPGSGGAAEPGVSGGNQGEPATARGPGERAPRMGSASRVVVVEGGVADPRRVGLNYVNLARFVSTSTRADAIANSRGEAMRAAEYIASHGYEVGVYPDGKVFKLIALRPFESTGDNAYKSFARDLKQIGKRYKAQEDGPVDFADLWAQKFSR